MADLPSLGDLTPEQFVLKAIERLRVPPYKGIHAVFSGFNEAFREYFPLLDPVDVTTQLAKEGKIFIRPVRKGVMLYKAEDMPQATSGENALKKILQTEDTAPPSPPSSY